MTHYVHTVHGRAARQASRYDHENEAVLLYMAHLRQRFWTATVSARRYGLSANTIHNRLRKK